MYSQYFLSARALVQVHISLVNGVAVDQAKTIRAENYYMADSDVQEFVAQVKKEASLMPTWYYHITSFQSRSRNLCFSWVRKIGETEWIETTS